MSTFTLGITLLSFCYWIYIVQAGKVFVSAPNTLRLDAEETVAIVTDNPNDASLFNVYLQDFPARKKTFSQQNVLVQNGRPTIAKIKVTAEDIPDFEIGNTKENTYVYLVVTRNGFHKESKLLVSPKSGYIFIQTDKPIYTPQQTVNIRILPLNKLLLPKNDQVRLQIRNPQDIVVQERVFEKPWNNPGNNLGPLFPTHIYKFPPHPLLGEWVVVAQYGHKFQINASVTFKVDEYVLPTFTVMLDVPNVILPEHTEVRVHTIANYVYGKKVKGTALFKFGVKHKLGNIIEIGRSQTKTLEDGEATVMFRTEEITNHPKIDAFPLESKLFVEVEVVDSATGNREKAINEECSFANSPYIISFKHSQRDFKPSLVSVILADVTYINGKPAAGIPTSISVVNSNGMLVEVTKPTDTSDEDGRVIYNVNTPIGSPVFKVTVKTNDKNYKESQQFSGTHILSEYKSSGGYVALSRLEGTRQYKVGRDFSVTVFTQPPKEIHNVFYMVLSRGRIVKADRLTNERLLQRELQFKITAEMVPSIRIVVFALYKDDLVADSIRLDVEHTCRSQADVEIETKFKDTTPGSEGNFLLRGEPETRVGILAVDKAIYALRNKDRLTKEKLFKTLENDDLGCGPGGGINTELVLANAGVTVFGDFRYNSNERKDLGCAERLRRKREAIDAVANEHGIEAKKCCKLGTISDKYGRTCEERANIVKNYTNEMDDGNCTIAFLKCCKNIFEGMSVADNAIIYDDRGRVVGIVGEELDFVEDLDEEEKDVTTRKDFRETWLFQDYLIGPDGTKAVVTNLPHSITTWVIQAVSISEQWGMCVSEPKELISFKNIFLHLNLPYSVIQNEQVEVQATIFNYNSRKVPVIVYMYGVEDLCTGVHPNEKSERKRIYVDPHSTATVGFPVVPLKDKEYTLRVVALSQIGHDVIEKKLRVAAQGETFEETIPVVLDPSNQRQRKERDVVTDVYTDSIDTSQMLQLTAVNLRPSKDYIPGTESCIISAIGDEFGPTVETVLQDPETLIRKPIGCGEQTMMYMGPTVYTLHYLKVKGKLTPEYEKKVFGLVREGYNRELTFRLNDGSYSAFPGRASSTWLTAFVMKIFCQSTKLIFIDQKVICSGINWLISQQNPDGSFTEKNPVIHWDMMGGNKGAVPMTAFVLISLQECTCEIEALQLSKFRAQHYLEGAIPNINDPYIMSLVAYALALSNSELKLIANEKLRSMATFDNGLNQRHWSKGSNSHAIETTAYALLAQVALEDMQYSLPIINWLNTKRLAGGVFPSTQDTVVALQALSAYSIRAQTPEINLHCNVTYSNDRKLSKTLNFQNDNSDVLQQFELEKVGGTVFFRTSGTGVGLLSVKLRYNVPRPIEKLCKFHVTVNVTEAKAAVKPAVVKDDVGKDFFDEIPEGLVRALNLEDEHADFRRDENIMFEDILPNGDLDGINPRMNQHIPNEIGDGNKDIDYDERGRQIDDYDDRDRDIDDDEERNVDNDERNRIGDEDEDDRSRINGKKLEKANSKAMLEIKICARYLSEDNTDMAIIDTGIFSGFKPVIEDLKKLINSAENTVDRFEMAGRSIIFYLNHIPHEKPVCLKFRITHEYRVGAVQPTVIKVYDYYSPDEACTVFYSPDSNSPLLRKICEGSVCQCAEGGCPHKEPFSGISKVRNKARDQLLLEACEKHDYVWKGIVESMKKKDGFIRIEYRITNVLKPGVEPKAEIEGLTKTLLLQDSCTSFALVENQSYLIMGNDGERFEDRETKHLEYRYLIDKTTKIHKWELIRQSPDKELQKALNWVETQLLKGGCRN